MGLQQWWRKIFAKLNKAATNIQRIYRGFIVRFRMRTAAALHIQRVVRGFLARRVVEKEKDRLRHLEFLRREEEDDHAIVAGSLASFVVCMYHWSYAVFGCVVVCRRCYRGRNGAVCFNHEARAGRS